MSVIRNLSVGLESNGITCLHHGIGFDAEPSKKALLYLCSFPKFMLKVIQHHVDIVHAHPSERWGFYRYIPYVFLCRLLKTPILFHMHGGSFKQFFDRGSAIEKWVILKTLKQVDVMLCLSEYWKSYFEELSPVHKYIIPNSVKTFNENCYNVQADGIVFVGFIEEQKGIFDLLEAFADLPDSSKYVLRICGAGDIDKLNRKIQELGLNKMVIIHGWVSEDERIAIFRQSKLFVLPSYFEALPMSLLEAMSFGLPVLVTNVGSIPEVVTAWENGYLVEPDDVSGLSKALKYMLDRPEELQEFSENNYQKIHTFYSVNSSVKALMYAYNEVLNKQDNPA